MGPALLLERGWAGFPCYPGTKRPAWPRGLHDATPDPDRLQSWWARHPHDNVAVNCGKSSLAVIDLDVKAGTDGIAVFSQLCEEHSQPWPETLTTRTPTGGMHLIFAGSTRSSGSRICAGADVKSRGGYVLVPNSAVDGHLYRTTGSRPVADLPEWLTVLNEPPVRPNPLIGQQPATTDRGRRWAAAALIYETRDVAQATDHRNDRLNRAAFKLGQLGHLLDHGQVVAELTAAATACGLDDHEIAPTIESGYRAGLANPRFRQ